MGVSPAGGDGLTPPLVDEAVAACRDRLDSQGGETGRILRYGATIGARIIHFDKATRCMDEARRSILACEREGRAFADGTVFVADTLTGGQGRFRRQWHAPPGGLWLTVVLAPTLLPESAALLPLAAGVACCEAVCDFGVAARVKWVNDVHVGGRKLAGILCQTLRTTGEDFILIGIGVNVNNTVFPPSLRPAATSMRLAAGRDFPLAAVGATLLARLRYQVGRLYAEEERRLAALDPAPSSHPLITDLRRLSDTLGRRVRYGHNVISAPQLTARAADFDPTGGLILELDDGTRLTEHAGEICYV